LPRIGRRRREFRMKGNQGLNMRSRGKCTLATIVLITFVAFGLVSWLAGLHVQAQTESHISSVSLPSMTLTIVASNGSEIVLDETDIGNMTSHRATGGRINSVGTISGVGNYTGVTINTFCALVGGFHQGQTFRVTAVDGYNMTFTYAQVNGDFVTYDSATGQQTQHNQSLTTILAYHFNDVNLTSGGPLRFAIVGSESLCTNSTYWVQKVVKLEILANVGGYLIPTNTFDLLAPYIGTTIIALVGTVAVSVYWKRTQRRKNNK
jgi:hypothetical protein